MAGMYYKADRRKWRVTWYVEGKRLQREFAEKSDAAEFIATAGLPDPAPRPGRKRRTRAQVASILRAESVESDTGCHVWTRSLTPAGYPRLTWLCDEGHLLHGGHRIACHLFTTPVPDDHRAVVDHLCRNRACVNPDHLELVTGRENIMRSPIAQGSINARKTHCANGHPYSPENTYVYTFKSKRTTVRTCRTCRSESRARRAAAKKAVA